MMNVAKGYQFLGSSSAKLAFRTVTQLKPADTLSEEEERALARLCDWLHATGGEVCVEDLFHSAKHRSYLNAAGRAFGCWSFAEPDATASKATDARGAPLVVLATRGSAGACADADAAQTSPLGSASDPTSDAFSEAGVARVPGDDAVDGAAAAAATATAVGGDRRAVDVVMEDGGVEPSGASSSPVCSMATATALAAAASAAARHSALGPALSDGSDASDDTGGPRDAAAAAAEAEQAAATAERVLSVAEDWSAFDARELAVAFGGAALSTLTMHLLRRHGVPSALGLDETALWRYLRAVEAAYLPNPYHCALHAADVVQALASMAAADNLYGRISPVEALALIVGSAVHDLAHPGLRNDFLVLTHSPAAIRYNDSSVNENMHASLAFEILREPGNNFFPTSRTAPADLGPWLEAGGAPPELWPETDLRLPGIFVFCRALRPLCRRLATQPDSGPVSPSSAGAVVAVPAVLGGLGGSARGPPGGSALTEAAPHVSTDLHGPSPLSVEGTEASVVEGTPTAAGDDSSDVVVAAAAAAAATPCTVDGPAAYREFRRLVIEAVLDTDCDRHCALVSRVRAAVARGPAHPGALPARTPEERADLLGFLLHVADISNPARPLDLCVGWARSLDVELGKQGAREAAIGMPHTCEATDPSKNVFAQGQVCFITRLLSPALDLAAAVCPAWVAMAKPHVSHALQYWGARIPVGATPPPSAPRATRPGVPLPRCTGAGM